MLLWFELDTESSMDLMVLFDSLCLPQVIGSGSDAVMDSCSCGMIVGDELIWILL